MTWGGSLSSKLPKSPAWPGSSLGSSVAGSRQAEGPVLELPEPLSVPVVSDPVLSSACPVVVEVVLVEVMLVVVPSDEVEVSVALLNVAAVSVSVEMSLDSSPPHAPNASTSPILAATELELDVVIIVLRAQSHIWGMLALFFDPCATKRFDRGR
jgi:hypothetical protein